MLSPALLLHISAGTVGVLAGGVAMSFRKGSQPHRTAGQVFVISMLTLTATGAYLGALKSQPSNVLAGAFTFYLVATAWDTARRKDGRAGLFDWSALLLIFATATSSVVLGVEAMHSPGAAKAGVPAAMYFFIGSMAALAMAGDVRMLVRGGVSGSQRLLRHLWRMCFGWFIASGSIFLARPHLFPAVMLRTHMLTVLGVLPLLLMIFWVIRVSFARSYKQEPSRRTVENAYSMRA
jgi:hypothetical protein